MLLAERLAADRPRPGRTRMALALLRPSLRAMRLAPLAGGVVVALALAVLPNAVGLTLSLPQAVLFLRGTAVALALGLAFVLDDPATATTEVLPVSARLRRLVRLAPVLVVAGAVWEISWLTMRQSTAGLPADLGWEGAGIAALTLAIAAWTSVGGVAAAPALLLLVLAAAFAPDAVAPFPAPRSPQWGETHVVWAVVTALAVIALGAAGDERNG
ncbi:hypothetical protein ACL02U_10525 [Streptomyces sp. MS06]|uniref:hypothetical protein n=1 Tax=Streptomyces sp. MS06 TaxID=3385974 RepID=UPI0039A293C3